MDPKQPRTACLGEIIYAQFHTEPPHVPARERPELEGSSELVLDLIDELGRNKNAPDEGASDPPTPQASNSDG